MSSPIESTRPPTLNRLRYLRIVTYAGGVAARIVWWYMIVQPLLGRRIVKRGESARLQRWTRQFRLLAVSLGGVMIKLGQFISSRMDILPPEIIQELSGLQDEVPPMPFKDMTTTIEQELGPTWRERFSTISEETVAAASFGQAYRAQLAENGDKVVIKVQRPGIVQLVHTDLSALKVVARFMMRFKFIARRANVPALQEEFARVMWEELDYINEADNAERFGELFADNMGVYIPSIYREHSTRRVLVMEDVTAIKLNDYAAIEAAGIDRNAVAQRLLDTYLTMVFVHRFFHADPHPGNIFIYPLPQDEMDLRQRKSGGTPFYLIFIDFGMAGHLTPDLASGLREALIALITRDSKRLVRSYQTLDVLLPGADVERIEQASEAVFNKVWGLNMSELTQMDYRDMHQIGRDFSDLLFSMPFQVPQDFLYLARAVGILTGMCTGLNPAFDPWKQIQPFVRNLLLEDGDNESPFDWWKLLNRQNVRDLLSPQMLELALASGREMVTTAATLPLKADLALTRLERGELSMRIEPDARFERHLQRIERTGKQVATGVVFASLTLASTLLYINGEPDMGAVGYTLSAVTLLVLFVQGRR